MDDLNHDKLCIVMPAYNEEGCISDVVTHWLSKIEHLVGRDGSLIVVNDGSRDGTGQILDSLKASNSQLVVLHQANGGHGVALLHGYEEALKRRAAWVFQVDSDDQFVSEEIELLWRERDKSPFILGTRKVRHDATHRLVITKIVRVVNALLFGAWIPDANIPFRLIKGSYLKDLLARIPKGVFAPNIFLSILAKKDGNDLLNIPVSHKDRQTGTVSIIRVKLLKVCVRSFQELLSFRVHGSSPRK